jgi:4-hydroxy-tetrahydrodipicolinate synthase
MLRRAKDPPKPPPAIGGVFVAAVTPRREREVEIDLGAMLELVDFIGGHPAQGIALFGTTGEFVHYTLEERSRYVSLLAKRSRVPVMANVSHSTLEGAVQMAEEAAGAGIAAVLLMPPYYFRYSAETVEAFFLEFGSLVAKWVPIYLYNIPLFTEAITADTVDRLMATGLFAGIKDSSGEWDYMNRLLAMRETHHFTLMVGNDRLFTRGRRHGASGGVSGVACAVPELMIAIDRSIQSGRIEAAQRLDGRLQEFIDAIGGLPTPIGVKAAVAVRGVKCGPFASPLGADGSARVEQFRAWFRDWLPVVLKECKEAGAG